MLQRRMETLGNTPTCFGPVYWPSSGCPITYRTTIKYVHVLPITHAHIVQLLDKLLDNLMMANTQGRNINPCTYCIVCSISYWTN